ncbi:hypothetical protein GLW08_20470 [Pontibacillus yanchengensis]|uniref:Flp pilus assembly protein TadB n=2 Tax=Pontibacillus yanchengensis TaxID=462910 RepID=A0A6I5A5A0_9BACI|nr:hypothetical protein [Pontibacillus yanchengensis]MYL35480.1 hypothetical protein [Pontibacillus yanchengensis]MYL55680.1 hypothetical protein [Pontibacillus yanchengensis]
MKEFLYQYFQEGYIILIAVLLLLTFLYSVQSGHDERRKRRFKASRLTDQGKEWLQKLQNPKYDRFFRSYGLPAYFTSARYNGVRVLILATLLIISMVEFAFNINILATTETITLLLLPIAMAPVKPMPALYIFRAIRKRYIKDKNEEVYQLYNEIKAEFKSRGRRIRNLYHLMNRLVPYYKTIRPTLERMMPLLEQKEFHKAWDLFEEDIGSEEATSLAVLMKDIEDKSFDEAFELIEERQKVFANSMYNEYKEYLTKRKTMIMVVVGIGAVFVFANVFVAFQLWYGDVMDAVNKVKTG